LEWYTEKTSCRVELALGMGYYKDKQYPSALERFENALEGTQETLGDEDTVACKALAGQCLFETKRIREGHTLFQTAIANHPGEPVLLCGYGRMLEKV